MKKYCSQCKPSTVYNSYKDYKDHIENLSVYQQSYHKRLGKWEVKAGSNCVLDVREIEDWEEQEVKENPVGEYPRCSLTGKKLKPGDTSYHYVHDVYSEERERTMRLGSVILCENAKNQVENATENESVVSFGGN